MLQLPHHQDLNMPPNFPMSNDSGFHETGKKKTDFLVLFYSLALKLPSKSHQMRTFSVQNNKVLAKATSFLSQSLFWTK